MKVWTEIVRRSDGRWAWHVWEGTVVIRRGSARWRWVARRAAVMSALRVESQQLGREC